MKTEKEITFEQAYEKAEYIARELESGSMSLEEAISSFEEAMNLMKICKDKLNKAESRVAEIVKSSTEIINFDNADILKLNFEEDNSDED